LEHQIAEQGYRYVTETHDFMYSALRDIDLLLYGCKCQMAHYCSRKTDWRSDCFVPHEFRCDRLPETKQHLEQYLQTRTTQDFPEDRHDEWAINDLQKMYEWSIQECSKRGFPLDECRLVVWTDV
jgi:hypothetical protein